MSGRDSTEICPVEISFFPPGMTVVLTGRWEIDVSCGVRAVVVTEAGGLEVRPSEPGDPLVKANGCDVRIYGIGAEWEATGKNAWLPWYSWAVLAGALAPHILAAMNGES